MVVLVALMAISIGCGYSDEKEELLITVESQLRDCPRMFAMDCLVVNGERFFNSIEGCEFEEGFYYRLKVERHDLFYEQEDPPGEEARYRYRLIEVVSKTPVQ